jgi:hypothetical protein
MGIARRWLVRGTAGLGVAAAAALTGCQTYPAGFGGMTLPSPHYLQHYPQYFPPDPAFPLQRELDSMQGAEGVLRPALPPGAAPLPAPPGALPGPIPAPGSPPPGSPIIPGTPPVPAPGVR